jgi:LacI family transcriptional regulator
MNLKELAAQLSLSKATVSRALSGHTDISAQTRERVRKAADAAGYIPAAMALKLRSGKSGAFGIVLPQSLTPFEHPIHTELLGGMAERVAEAGLDLIVTVPPPGGDEVSAIHRLVEGRRVDGIVLTRLLTNDSRVDYLHSRRFPFVTFGRTPLSDRHPWLDIDGHAAMLAATRRLTSFGHRHIAHIAAPPLFCFASHRRTGFHKGMIEAGLTVDPAMSLVAELGGESAIEPIVDLLAAHPEITALLCDTDGMALSALKAIRRIGKQPGREISVIGYGDLPIATQSEPALTTSGYRVRAAGRRLIEMLMAHQRGEAPENLQELWQPHLLVRQSDGACPS